MEYVDGEDLGGLLRRIGRLPDDKAIEIARKLCAGLAAAHAKGVLHRDLKPANIMIDGRGQVLIMDFGLAAIADQVEGAEVRNGTPAYMAPEQLAGREVTERSDLYALGLVLYEVFTGQRGSRAPNGARSPAPQAPSKTSTPRLKARSRVASIPSRPNARSRRWLWLECCRVAIPWPKHWLLATHAIARNGRGFGRNRRPASGRGLGFAGRSRGGSRRSDPVECAIQCLSARAARKTAGRAGRASEGYFAECRVFRPAGGHGDGLRSKGCVSKLYCGPRQIRRRAGTVSRPGAFEFWYRGSPMRFAGQSTHSFNFLPAVGIVLADDPPFNWLAGTTLVRLNPLGRLTQLIAVPPQVEEPAGAEASPDWAPLFTATGLDPSKWPFRRDLPGHPPFIATRVPRGLGRWLSAPIFRCESRQPRIAASLTTSS